MLDIGRLQRDVVLDVAGRLDFQLTDLGRDGVVVGNGSSVQRVGEAVVALADVRLRAGHVVVRALAADKAFAGDRDGAVRQRLAVVDLFIARGGQGDGALRDGQLLRAGDFAFVVLARGADLNGLALGNVLRGDRRRVGRPRCAVYAILDLDCATLAVDGGRRPGGVGRAVVLMLDVSRRQRDVVLNVARRRDGQRAGLVGDVVVVGDVLAAGVLDDRRGRIVLAAASFRLAAGHGDALNGVAVCQRRADVGVLRERRAVVGLTGGIRRDRQRLRPDDQCAFHTGDGVVLRKCVVFQRVIGDFVGTFADIRLAAGNRHIRETFPVHELALGDLVARRRQRRAVVGLVGGIRRQLDRDRRDGQLLRAGHAAFVVGARDADLNGHAVRNVGRLDRRRVGRPRCAVYAILDLDCATLAVDGGRRSGIVRIAVVLLHDIGRRQRDVIDFA